MNENEVKRCLKDPDYMIKKFYMSNKFCMSLNKQNCKGDIINSHSISRKYLENIAEDGQVIMPYASSHNKSALFEFKLKGLKNASCFMGFCEYHDNSLFESFEKNDFVGKYEQIYDLSLRALCQEYFQKKCKQLFFDKISSDELKHLDQTGYLHSKYFKKERQNTIKALRDRKFLYEQIQKYKLKGLNYLLLTTDKLPIAGTGILYPLFDARGDKIQRENNRQHGFIYNIIPSQNNSHIIVCTPDSLHNNVHKKYLLSILSLNNIKDIINHILTLVFFMNDNVAIRPSWYNSQDNVFKNQLIELMNAFVGNYSETVYVVKPVDFYGVIKPLNFRIFNSIKSSF